MKLSFYFLPYLLAISSITSTFAATKTPKTTPSETQVSTKSSSGATNMKGTSQSSGKPSTSPTPTSVSVSGSASAGSVVVSSSGKPSSSGVTSSSSAVPSSSGQCSLSKDMTEKALRKRRIARSARFAHRSKPETLFHATCKESVEAIRGGITARKLFRGRNWPDEFSWKGGFYLTPERENAVLFGKTFRQPFCYEGLVILEFQFKRDGLIITDVGSMTEISQNFFDMQDTLAFQLKTDNPQAASPEEVTIFSVCEDPAMAQAYGTIQNSDVVVGAVPLTEDTKEAAAALGGETPKDPFNQVVIVSNEGLRGLSKMKVKSP